MMDNHFKHKLQRFRVDWDKEELWEELEPKLPRPRHRILRYWWVLLPLLFIPACWGELTHWLHTGTMGEEQAAAKQNLPVQQSNESDVAVTIESPESTIEAGIVEQGAVALPSYDQSYVPIPTQIYQRQQQEQLASGGYRTIESISIEVAPVERETPALTDYKEELGGVSAKSDTDKVSNTLKVNSFVERVSRREKMAVLPALPMKKAVVQAPETKEEPIDAITETVMTRPFRSDEQGIFVNLMAGAGTLQRQDDYTAVEPAIVEYRRENSERLDPQAAWNLQLEAGYRHHSGFSLSTGLGYGQLHEQFNFDGVVREDTFVQINEQARYFVKPSGDTLFLSGPGVYTQLVNRQVLHNNQVSYYQIPLLLAYRFPKKRWDIELTAGVNYLLRSQYRGRISEGFPARIIDDPEFALKRRWGYTMRVGVQYQLLPATYLYLNTQFMQSPEFLRVDVGQQYRSLGLQVGLQYRFRRKL